MNQLYVHMARTAENVHGVTESGSSPTLLEVDLILRGQRWGAKEEVDSDTQSDQLLKELVQTLALPCPSAAPRM